MGFAPKQGKKRSFRSKRRLLGAKIRTNKNAEADGYVVVMVHLSRTEQIILWGIAILIAANFSSQGQIPEAVATLAIAYVLTNT